MENSRIAIVWNSTKPGAEACARVVAERAEKYGFSVMTTCEFPVKKTTLENCRLCCVIGGDGTILGAVPGATANNVPVFGINLGKLGYLANYAAKDIERDLEMIFSGKFRQVPHALLECRVGPAGTPLYALNDIVIKSKDAFRLTTLRVDSREHGLLNTFRGDGLIFATSTGSTAYSLSAGGPLVHSEADVFVMTPLSPHTLSNRTIVLPRAMHLEVSNENPGVPAAVAVDGRTPLSLEAGEKVFIELSQKKINILQPESLSEFEILRTKLKWV